jgi:hypothetical protein
MKKQNLKAALPCAASAARNIVQGVKHSALALCAAAAIGGAMYITSCSQKGDDGNGGGNGNIFDLPDNSSYGTFTPTSGADEATIKGWIHAANNALKTAPKGIIMYGVDGIIQWDQAAKRRLEAELYEKTIEGMHCAEGDKLYDYGETWVSNDKPEVMTYTLEYPPIDADKYFSGAGEIIDIDDNSNGTWSFSVVGEKIVVKKSDEYEITLTADGRYKQVKYTHSGDTPKNRDYYYDANVDLPSGFSRSQFEDKRSNYVSATINWGEGKGTNKLWVDATDDKSSIYPQDIFLYAPDVAGKVIDKIEVGSKTYCRDCSCTYEYEPSYTEICTPVGCDGNFYSSLSITAGVEIKVIWK